MYAMKPGQLRGLRTPVAQPNLAVRVGLVKSTQQTAATPTFAQPRRPYLITALPTESSSAMAAKVCNAVEHIDVGSELPQVVSTLQNFEDMMTLLGGATDSCLRGYVGQWRTWAATPTTSSDSTAQAAVAAGELQLQVEDINFRLFQLQGTDPPTIHQVNMYQKPNKASPAYKQYLQDDQTSGRSDGYGVREWDVRPIGTLWETSAPWMSGADPSTPPESTLVGLAVRNTSLGLFNGGLPIHCDNTQPWYLEVINRAPSSHARRWGILLRYDGCKVTNVRTIHEDAYETTQQQISQRCIDPTTFEFVHRGDSLPSDLDSWAAHHVLATGKSVTFSYNEQHQLTKSTQPCSWSSTHATQDHVTQTFPDGMYIKVPRSIASHSAGTEVVLEFGVVLSDGSLARWLVKYDNSGKRLLNKATHELYPTRTNSVSDGKTGAGIFAAKQLEGACGRP